MNQQEIFNGLWTITKEKHNAAIEVMKSCQVDIVSSKDVVCGDKK